MPPSTSWVAPWPPTCASPDSGPIVPLLDDPPGCKEFSVHTTLSPLPRPEPPARWCPLMCAPPDLRSGWGSCWLRVCGQNLPVQTGASTHVWTSPLMGRTRVEVGRKVGWALAGGQLPQHGRALALNTRNSRALSGASPVAQMVKNLPTVQETWVWSLGWEDPLEEGMAAHSSILAWRIPKDRGALRATVHGVAKSHMTEWLGTAQHGQYCCREIHGQRSLVTYNPWDLKESAMTSQLNHHHHHLDTNQAFHVVMKAC